MRKDDKADLSLRSVYNYGNYGFTAIFNTSDKVNVTATIDKVSRAARLLQPAELLQACSTSSSSWQGAGGRQSSLAPVAQ